MHRVRLSVRENRLVSTTLSAVERAPVIDMPAPLKPLSAVDFEAGCLRAAGARQ